MTDTWVRGGDKPFGTLLSYCGTYLHPDDYYGGLEQLRLQVSVPEEERHPDTKQFLVELRRVIVGDTEGLPKDALFEAAQYDDGSDDAFVKRVWAQLFPDEPLPTKG
ncbi:hypothetical protein [Tenggerimyces flavus]|uniref:Uncharacterized protein n=1 Tax=Tenggerimyces flavus TaxID=1708749 RepID=A0ABV7YDB1_9ACTN|nr:hypothetical protein [Tenggerimyces flavus]MBM7791380.1 hypothetical protein [Tenggerimyces flavus]